MERFNNILYIIMSMLFFIKKGIKVLFGYFIDRFIPIVITLLLLGSATAFSYFCVWLYYNCFIVFIIFIIFFCCFVGWMRSLEGDDNYTY